MLPTTASKGRGAARSAPPLFGPYLRRIVKVRTRRRFAFPKPRTRSASLAASPLLLPIWRRVPARSEGCET
jgi:hypothetical protein